MAADKDAELKTLEKQIEEAMKGGKSLADLGDMFKRLDQLRQRKEKKRWVLEAPPSSTLPRRLRHVGNGKPTPRVPSEFSLESIEPSALPAPPASSAPPTSSMYPYPAPMYAYPMSSPVYPYAYGYTYPTPSPAYPYTYSTPLPAPSPTPVHVGGRPTSYVYPAPSSSTPPPVISGATATPLKKHHRAPEKVSGATDDFKDRLACSIIEMFKVTGSTNVPSLDQLQKVINQWINLPNTGDGEEDTKQTLQYIIDYMKSKGITLHIVTGGFEDVPNDKFKTWPECIAKKTFTVFLDGRNLEFAYLA